MRISIAARTTDQPMWVVVVRHMSIWIVCITLIVFGLVAVRPPAPLRAPTPVADERQVSGTVRFGSGRLAIFGHLCQAITMVTLGDEPCRSVRNAMLAPGDSR